MRTNVEALRRDEDPVLECISVIEVQGLVHLTVLAIEAHSREDRRTGTAAWSGREAGARRRVAEEQDAFLGFR